MLQDTFSNSPKPDFKAVLDKKPVKKGQACEGCPKEPTVECLMMRLNTGNC